MLELALRSWLPPLVGAALGLASACGGLATSGRDGTGGSSGSGSGGGAGSGASAGSGGSSGSGGSYGAGGASGTSGHGGSAGAGGTTGTGVGGTSGSGCGSTTCPDGCCSAAGNCLHHSAQSASECGTGGLACSVCAGACALGECLVTLATAPVSLLGSPSTIAVDASSVYWTAGVMGGTVMKVAVAGGALTTLASGQAYPNGIAVDASSVYWTDMVYTGTVQKIPLTGGT